MNNLLFNTEYFDITRDIDALHCSQTEQNHTTDIQIPPKSHANTNQMSPKYTNTN